MMKRFRLNIGGPKGNAFYILGLVGQLCSNKKTAEHIRNEMKAHDYNYLLRGFAQSFPSVELYSDHDLGDNVDRDLYVVDTDIIEL